MESRRRGLGRWVGRLVRFAALLAVAALVVYWGWFAPVAVIAHRLEREPIVADVLGAGVLEARVRATISPKITGRIAAILADQGDRVEVGAALVRLDDEELRQQVAIAQANEEAAKAKVDRLKAEKARAIGVLAQAKSSFERVRALTARNVSSQEELDRATEALRVAEAGLSGAEAGISEGEKELIAATETLRYQRARLADATVSAPFAGLITRRHREPGDVVPAGGAILALVATEELWVSAWVDETEMARLKPEQPARVVFRSEPDRSFPGRVARLGREADRETREFVVDVRVLELPTNWAVGQRAEVYIETDRKDAAARLPARFLAWRDDAPGVFVNENGRAVWKPIQIGLRSAEFVEAAEGLHEGETVVMAQKPGTTLVEGRRIQAP